MWDALVGGLLGKVAPKVADYYIQKQQLKYELKLEKFKVQIAENQARRQYIENSENRDHEWELAQIRNSGWKDEYVLILLSIPLVLVFVPATQLYVLDGFAVLDQTPAWYQWLIGAVFTAVYGIRVWRRKVSGQ